MVWTQLGKSNIYAYKFHSELFLTLGPSFRLYHTEHYISQLTRVHLSRTARNTYHQLTIKFHLLLIPECNCNLFGLGRGKLAYSTITAIILMT